MRTNIIKNISFLGYWENLPKYEMPSSGLEVLTIVVVINSLGESGFKKDPLMITKSFPRIEKCLKTTHHEVSSGYVWGVQYK